MKRFAFLLVAVATVAAVVASMIPASGQAVGQPAPVFVNQNARRLPRLAGDLRGP